MAVTWPTDHDMTNELHTLQQRTQEGGEGGANRLKGVKGFI
jgi:hypothetical protein